MSGGAPGLYVHVPFCARACPYCDFDFEVGRRPDLDGFLHALERERQLRELPAGQPVRTVYVGGGTPSLLGPVGLRQLLAWIEASFDVSAAVERTVELNPEHVDDALLDALTEAGIDRVSLGVQSLGTDALAQLGRVHRATQARAALRAAVARGLRVTADLIVGWPGQSEAALRSDVQGLLETGVEHVSVYALTVEEGTPWDRLARRGRRQLPDGDVQAQRLQQASELLRAAGLVHYEVASYARDGAIAQHNLGYWQWRDYLGLGPSAASATYDDDGSVLRRTNARGLARWAADPGGRGSGYGSDYGSGDASEERLAAEAAAAEGLWLGLRALQGIDVGELLGRFPAVDEAWLRKRAAASLARGNLEWTPDGGLRVAPGRWLWHDEIGASLLEPGPADDAPADPALR